MATPSLIGSIDTFNAFSKSLDTSHIVDSGTDVLVVGWGLNVARAGDAVTWDAPGVNEALTRLEDVGTNIGELWLYALTGPTAKTANINAKYNGSVDIMQGSIYNIQDVDQVTPTAARNTATGNSVTPSVTVTTGSDEFITDCVNAEDAPGFDSAGADQTIMTEIANTFSLGVSRQLGSDGGVMSWNITISARDWAIIAASWQDVAAAIQPHFEFRVPEFS